MSLDRLYPIFDGLCWLECVLLLGVKLVHPRVKDVAETDLPKIVARVQALSRRMEPYWWSTTTGAMPSRRAATGIWGRRTSTQPTHMPSAGRA